jgi:hypothetical protein
MKRGVVSCRVALLLRSAEIKPLFRRFVRMNEFFLSLFSLFPNQCIPPFPLSLPFFLILLYGFSLLNLQGNLWSEMGNFLKYCPRVFGANPVDSGLSGGSSGLLG